MGECIDRYTFTAFGELIEHEGEDPNPYLFAGEMTDQNSGFIYLRARWMDAGVGRFVSMDTFSGLEFEPGTIHKYLYTANNPANAIDPTGRFTLAETLHAVSTAMRLFTIASVSVRLIEIVTLTLNDELTVREAMWEIGKVGIDLGLAYVGGWVLNRVLKFGFVSVSKLPQLIKLVNRNRLKGKFAEKLWSAMNGVPKNNGNFGGTKPDFVRAGRFDELKYYEGTKPLSLTNQLRKMTNYGARNNIPTYLHVPPGASIGSELMQALQRTGGGVIYDLPRLQFQTWLTFERSWELFTEEPEEYWP